jgi:hypothetical protein
LVTVLLVLTGAVYVFVDSTKLLHTVFRADSVGLSLTLGFLWFIELHLAARVWLRDDETLVFEGLFRKWNIVPSAISKFFVFGGFAIVRHTDGFVLLPGKITGGDDLVRWVTKYRNQHGYPIGGDSKDGRRET